MIDRRQFLCAAAGAAVVVGEVRAAAKYDLIVKGGRVMDPASGLDAMRDVAISGGKIAAVKAGLSGAAETIDAKGKLVVPGLIDIHTHAAREKNGPELCLEDGVTGLIDAGSQGADRIQEPLAVARTARQTCRLLLNIGRAGILSDGDTLDLKRADVSAARAAIEANREMVVGIKARLSPENAGSNDYEVLRRTQEVAKPLQIPIMIHMGQTMTPLGKLLDLLKPGDIVTHMFAPPPHSILGDDGKIIPEALAARKRGVKFDVGNGRTGHLRWDIADKMMQAGFVPDTFSTDWNAESRTGGQVIDFPNVLSKGLLIGMSLRDVIACGTVNPSKLFPVFHGKGTLKVGAPADVTILDLREASFDFVDNYTNKRMGKQRLFPSATILAGKKVAQRS